VDGGAKPRLVMHPDAVIGFRTVLPGAPFKAARDVDGT
jgi:hypothetical protein